MGAAFSAMLLLAAMFVAVHRGARGRAIAESIGRLGDRLEVIELRRSELRQEIELLRSRPRIVRAARELGLHEPSEEELVYLDLSHIAQRGWGGSS
jgi:hypothetical protein